MTLGISALESARRAADTISILNATFMLQTLAPSSRAAAAALPPPSELLAMARAAHQKVFEGILLPLLALQSLATGDVSAAAGWCAAALAIYGYDPASYPVPYAIFAVVEIAVSHGDHEFAARIHGRLRVSQARLHAAMSASFVTSHLAAVEKARSALGDASFDAAVAAGTGQPWESAIGEVSDYLRNLARRAAVEPDAPTEPQSPHPPLTERQVEVIRLLSNGLTNKEIARMLGLTPKTVMHHTIAIYQRLGVRGRSEAVAWAVRAGVTPAER